MSWLKDVIGTEKAVIAMCHLKAMPGDPGYEKDKGMKWVVERAKYELDGLQRGGVDAVMFSNEFSLPYLTNIRRETVGAMARIIGELMHELSVPYGVNCLWDPAASLELAVATDAKFVREIFTGVYASDFGLWNTNCGEVIRHKNAIGAENVKCLFNIVPEAAKYLAERDIESIAKTTVFNCNPDALCVSGATAGVETDHTTLAAVKRAVPNTVVIANTGCRIDNIEKQLSVADACVVGTTFKKDGLFKNEVEYERVKAFMDKVKSFRG